jgi:hypothetical protein
MIPSASFRLLTQDNTIPGNKKDGFRFHHLLFVIIVTPIYLWFELSFGVHLLDSISGVNSLENTIAIEHWGRLISGFAVALLFLNGWVAQSEKMDTHWAARIGVGIAITIVCIVLTWWAQGKVIDFYIQRTTVEISVALGVLALDMVIGFLLLRYWIRYSSAQARCSYVKMVLGFVVILIGGYATIASVQYFLPSFTEKLGVERQRAATLTLVRRSIQEGIYSLKGTEKDGNVLARPEGKAFLALFPIFGVGLNQDRFAADRPMLLAEMMYRDWDKQYGENSFNAMKDTYAEAEKLHGSTYRDASAQFQRDVASKGRAKATEEWTSFIRGQLEGEVVPPGMSQTTFMKEPAIGRFVGKRLACFDCVFRSNMTREELGRELFKWTQATNVKQILETLESSQHFEKGHDGETAARTYWVPIWALLFSMIGAFTHMFKLVFTVTEYAHRQSFHAINAADSPLANRVVENSRIVTAAVTIGIGLFIYFADNQVTSHEGYKELRKSIWQKQPIVGGLAAHWTVNAQGFIYPFTSKIKPDWLKFRDDPTDRIPIVRNWVARDE